MAKRSFYRNQKSLSLRQIVLAGLILSAVGGAIWKLIDMRANQNETILNPEISLNAAPPANDPPITLPASSDPAIDLPIVVDNTTTTPTPSGQPQPPVEPVVNTASQRGKEIIAQATREIADNKIVSARQLLNQAIKMGLPAEQNTQIRALFNQAAQTWLFSRATFKDDPYCLLYSVAPGDNLNNIGKKYDLPYQFLMRINGIPDPSRLRAKQNIKVVQGPFHAVVYKSLCLLDVYLGDTMVCSFPISIGLAERDTPTGTWRVKRNSKLINPEWVDPDTGQKFLPDDPRNPLGERWIGLDGVDGNAVGRTGFGLHGTIEPEKVGKPASRGCIRLINKDVELLYDMLLEDKSIVKVFDQPPAFSAPFDRRRPPV